ncbi:MAG: MBL fold metallo-hydrolase [Acidimicrobiia bacterium]|nr:MBL fold metallo-hydrolase [Acidimicrobiia bacterium]MDH4306474.1 MBL fold metallo-hydrolase [Acidimicrobiia bacterium]MDH5292942.1 MBL fold metallo-hydrolase [Acidimicrobiia bacterium]
MSWVFEDDSVRIAKITVGEWDNNVYVVNCVSTNRAVVVDAANEADRILDLVDGLEVEKVLTTHGHFDHIMALDDVTRALGVPWYMHLADVEIAERSPDGPLSHGDVIEVGEIAIHVLHTPGHTPGSVSFVIEPTILSGDTLFPGGPGATRWDYSDFGQIMDSVERHLMAFPDPTVVHPGHGLSTTLGEERPHLAEWRARGW